MEDHMEQCIKKTISYLDQVLKKYDTAILTHADNMEMVNLLTTALYSAMDTAEIIDLAQPQNTTEKTTDTEKHAIRLTLKHRQIIHWQGIGWYTWSDACRWIKTESPKGLYKYLNFKNTVSC